MKTIVCTLIFLFASNVIVGQTVDTVFNSVMVIPFNPKMYISNADRDITAYSEMSHDDIRERFRLGLDVNLYVKILTKYSSFSLLKDTSAKAFYDLQRIYNSLDYKYAIPQRVLISSQEENKKVKNKIKNFFKRDKDSKSEVEHGLFYDHTTKEVREHEKEKFLNVELKDSTLLPYLHETYGTELFLFINQFDINTDFESCIDLENGIYERIIKVHFSIYNQDNILMDGDYVEVRFPSNENNIIDIMKNRLPIIAEYCVKKLPYYKKNQE